MPMALVKNGDTFVYLYLKRQKQNVNTTDSLENVWSLTSGVP